MTMLFNDYSDGIEACEKCADACERCWTASIADRNATKMLKCVSLCIGCSVICRSAVDCMISDNEEAERIRQLTAEMCRICARECEKHKRRHSQECAEACRRCAEECSPFLPENSSRVSGDALMSKPF